MQRTNDFIKENLEYDQGCPNFFKPLYTMENLPQSRNVWKLFIILSFIIHVNCFSANMKTNSISTAIVQKNNIDYFIITNRLRSSKVRKGIY